MLARQVKEPPLSPCQRLGTPVSADLAELLMQCLAKSPGQRPPGAEALARALGRCCSAETWTAAHAEHRWRAYIGAGEALPAATMAEKTLVIAPRP